jgi:hypothetical protein
MLSHRIATPSHTATGVKYELMAIQSSANPLLSAKAKEGPIEQSDIKAAEQLTHAYQQMTEQLGRVIVGQQEVLKQVMIALFCQGHCILEGVPGLAKTLMIASIADLLSLNFRRIQFTPDLMPSDITGTEILDEEEGTGRRRMRFVKGPIFANILLGDEINRTPPKTQAALLQAMQEYKVTTAGEDYALEKPFLVLGTQNPIASCSRFWSNIPTSTTSWRLPNRRLAATCRSSSRSSTELKSCNCSARCEKCWWAAAFRRTP